MNFDSVCSKMSQVKPLTQWQVHGLDHPLTQFSIRKEFPFLHIRKAHAMKPIDFVDVLHKHLHMNLL